MAITSFKQPFQPDTAVSSPEFQPQEDELYLTTKKEVLAFEDFQASKNYSKRNSESNLSKKKYLEQLLITFEPDNCINYIQENILKTNDISENRRVLIATPYRTEWFNYILDIVITDINKGRRFSKLKSLRVIKKILINQIELSKETGNLAIEKTTTNKIFYIYQAFFNDSKGIQECISVLLKSQKLNEEQIKWIILNYKNSEYAINRLLRYPGKSKALSAWAEDVYINELLKHREEKKTWVDWFEISNSKKSLLKRESEIIAILIDKDIPSFVDKRNTDTIMWAIYYAQIPDNTKQRLMKKHYKFDSFEAAVEVSTRLKYFSVLKFIQEKL
jgi:hypothetical protein